VTRRSRGACWLAAALAGACAAAPSWQADLPAALQAARDARRDLVVFFALPGRDASDRMQQQLGAPVVLDALAAGGFVAAVCDGADRERLYARWIGGSEGMGIAVVDAEGRCWAARPGPQDPPELAALLRLCAASREPLRAAWAAADAPGAGPRERHALGCLLLQLGNRVASQPLLLAAAVDGVADARHRLARLFALDGNLQDARRWLVQAPRTPQALVTEGYVLFKERRHAEAVATFERALAGGGLAEDRQRALLYLGKALHEDRQDARAVPLLEALAAEATGSVFEASAVHTLGHIRNPSHGHSH
jgi:hypothetical protein